MPLHGTFTCGVTVTFRSIGLAFQMHWLIPVLGGAAVVLCCLASGGLGMLRVLKLEPSVVFKG